MSSNQELLRVSTPEVGDRELYYLKEALNRGEISSQGSFVRDFENRFAKFVGSKFALTTSNGTTALHLALLAAGIKEGDEVIVPSITFIATANAVKYIGAVPVFVDIHDTYWCMDELAISSLITEKTKGIIPVHIYGHPANMDPILKIAKEHNLVVVEDAAEAHGAKYRNKVVGNLGHAGIFSFYGNKILTTGEGGILVTDSETIYENAKLLRDHGADPEKRFWHSVVGYNYRMTNLQAALGLAQMEKFEEFLKKRKIISEMYRDFLISEDVISFQKQQSWSDSVCWVFTILIHVDIDNFRDDLIRHLLSKNIETRPMFYPIHNMPPYKVTGRLGQTDFPNSEYVSAHGISLPTSVTMTEGDIQRVSREVKDYISRL